MQRRYTVAPTVLGVDFMIVSGAISMPEYHHAHLHVAAPSLTVQAIIGAK